MLCKKWYLNTRFKLITILSIRQQWDKTKTGVKWISCKFSMMQTCTASLAWKVNVRLPISSFVVFCSECNGSETWAHSLLNITRIPPGLLFSVQFCSWASLAAEYSLPCSHMCPNFTGNSHSLEQTRTRPRLLCQSCVEWSCRGDPSRPLTTSFPPYLLSLQPPSLPPHSCCRLSGSANTSELHCHGSRWSSTHSLGIFIYMSLLKWGTVRIKGGIMG